jgi:predicted nucleotidyltransferase
MSGQINLPNWPGAVLVVNRCHPSLIDDQFQPLIDAAIAACLETLPGIVDVRLQGSVARGEAIQGQSDIDFMALVAERPDEDARAQLQDHAARLSRRHAVVSRVELDVAAGSDLIPFQLLALASDSLSVYGTDTLTVREQWVDRVELSRLVTPDAGSLLVDYREFVEESRQSGNEAMRFCSRIVGKDLLKCARALVLLRGGAYEVAIDRISAQIHDVVPELAPLAERLYRLYSTPVTDADVVIEVLGEASATLLPAMRPAPLQDSAG